MGEKETKLILNRKGEVADWWDLQASRLYLYYDPDYVDGEMKRYRKHAQMDTDGGQDLKRVLAKIFDELVILHQK